MTTHIRPAIAALTASLALFSCAHDKPAPEKIEAEQPQKPAHPDPGPRLSQKSRAFAATVIDPIDVQPAGTFTRGAHTWVALETPDLQLRNHLWLKVDADTHAMAVPAGDKGTQILVRFGAPKAPDTFSLTVSWNNNPVKGGSTQTLKVSGASKAPADSALPTRFLGAASTWFSRRTGLWWNRAPFDAYATHRLKLLADGLSQDQRAQRQNRRRTDVGQLMDLYTGLQSVEEALQTDRALMMRGDDQSKATIPLSDLPGVPLPPHAWPKMIAELPDKPIIEPMAAHIPHDMLYLHFHDLRTFVRLTRDLGEWLSPLSMALESKPGPSWFTDRIETQLVVERTALSEKLGHLAAHAVAVTTTDPFLREGGDLSIIFLVKNETMLEGALGAFEARAKQRRPDLEVATYTLDGISVRTLSTPDRAVHQHRARFGDLLVVSNSKAALSRLIDTHKGRLKAMKDSGDFQYMRARYPFDPKGEDGFVFVSDAFVGHVVSPRVKILQARRLEAQADLQAINHAALLHGWLEGQPPRDLKALLASGLVMPAELKHAEGTPIQFAPEKGAWSEVWGRPSSLTPIVELGLDKVTAAEKAAYERFVTGYQMYWRGAIDPIAARVRRSEDGGELDVEALMLPLIEGTEYRELREQVGDKTMPMPVGAEGFRWSLAVGKDAGLRRMVDGLARDMTGSRDIGLGWLGDWVMVGVGDRSGLWDLILASGEVPGAHMDENIEGLLGRAPLYVGAHVRNKLGLAATLSAARAFIDTAAPGMVGWIQSEPYRDIPITEVREKHVVRTARDPIALHYAIVGDVFIASLDRATLEIQMDALLDADESAGGPSVQSALTLNPVQGQSWLMRSVLAIMERRVRDNQTLAARSFEVLANGLGASFEGARQRELAIAYLGYEPASAHGGQFEMAQGGFADHSLYRSDITPNFLALPVAESPLTRLMARLTGLGMGLSFDGEGEHLGLKARVKLVRGSGGE